MPPHAFCRQCGYWVTAEMLLRDKEGISLSEARAIIDGSKNINDVATGSHRSSVRSVKATKAEIDGAPCLEWQWNAEWFWKMCKKALWSEAGAKALQWLRDRGLTDDFIDTHDFGYNPRDWAVDHPDDWGLNEKLWLPRGITLPYLGQGQVWKIEIRRATNQKKDRYWNVKGSANALYGYEGLEFKGKTVVCEGVFDAVAMEQAMQEAGTSGIAVVATGSTNGACEERWIMKLSLCDSVALVHDNDEGGDKAARWWKSRISEAKRWVPTSHDINEMWLTDRAGLIDAIDCGFVAREQCKVCSLSSVSEDVYGQAWCAEHFPVMAENGDDCEEYCFECGETLDSYDVYGRAWCTMHAPGEAVVEPLMPVQEVMPISVEPLAEPVQEVIEQPVSAVQKPRQKLPPWLIPGDREWDKLVKRVGLKEAGERRRAALAESH